MTTNWRDELIDEGLTFSDISLRPQFSELETRAAKEGGPATDTRLTTNIELAIPIVSANMDTVTESNMAIAVAKFGGIGIIHRNCSVEYQVREVEKVKRAEEGLIREPYTLSPENYIDRARELMAEKQVDSVLIVGADRKLVGLLTKYELAGAGGFEAVGKHMKPLQKLIVVKTEINIDEDEAEKLARKTFDEHPFLGKLPFIDEEGRLIGFVTKKSLLRRAEYPDATRDENGRLRVGAAVGVDEDALRRADALLIADADILVLDVAHGHAKKPMEMAKIIRKRYPDCQLMVGNVATLEAVRDFAKLKVGAIKVGIGPGATCSTRIATGVGVPQVSALLECAREANDYDIPIIADGGIRISGDVTKAIACGASSVMIGTLFAGTDESPGDLIRVNNKLYKNVRGMSSLGVNLNIRGESFLRVGLREMIEPEGIEGRVPHRGPLIRNLGPLVGGLRSGMTYVGAATIKELQRPFERKFTRVSRAALEESNPHDVEII